MRSGLRGRFAADTMTSALISNGPNVLRAAVCFALPAVLAAHSLVLRSRMHALAMHVRRLHGHSLLSSEQLMVAPVLRLDSASRYDAALKGPGPVRITLSGTELGLSTAASD